jgi:hypothetical protein
LDLPCQRPPEPGAWHAHLGQGHADAASSVPRGVVGVQAPTTTNDTVAAIVN